ncbi:MAG TPA: DedA family protein [Elusimicrobia bacterium]|nr:MAG: SNARE associated Golgi protein [Elusimicrobia bacterium GWA2_66_18]OGR77338.1 MAG: SNARE associated Golgi protein [Elusimicrobia bacterium GWC2_65_9]HAZ08307.1 DedA family protein [Elusimicrobiota bacterium]
MQDQFHALLKIWFHFVETWGYLGVFLLMALESSIVPVPSEVVMPPAAYWAAQGRMSFWGVVLAGTAGSWFGSIVSYAVSRLVGEPFVRRYGKFVLIPEAKVAAMEGWVREYGVSGIFFARLLPVMRHLISIPAGILKMPVGAFSAATTAGAFLWCAALSWFGMRVIGDAPQLLDSPAELARVLKDRMHLVVAAVVLLAAAYAAMTGLRKRASKPQVQA